MFVKVLGSAAGGGFPQWNCNCANCRGLRHGRIRAQARTQSSIAVSEDRIHWVLINASPDIRHQILANPELQPSRGARDTGIAAVVLMDSQIDHTTGVLSLREGSGLALFTTAAVYEDLTSRFPVVSMLEHYCGIDWHEVPVDGDGFTVPVAPRLSFAAIPLSSKAPPYSPHRNDPRRGDNIGLIVRDREGGSLFYAPGLGRMETPVLEAMNAADCLLVDGTFWLSDDLARAGAGHKRAEDMGHLPLAGEGGLMSYLRDLQRPRKLLIHINNTNPILDEDSAERHELTQAGIEVAKDGMTITV